MRLLAIQFLELQFKRQNPLLPIVGSQLVSMIRQLLCTVAFELPCKVGYLSLELLLRLQMLHNFVITSVIRTAVRRFRSLSFTFGLVARSLLVVSRLLVMLLLMLLLGILLRRLG